VREVGAAVAAEPPAGRTRPSLGARVGGRISEGLYRYSVVWALLLLIVIFGALEPDTFLTAANASSILGSQAILLIVALGLTVCLAVNEFDLSVGATATLGQVVFATLAVKEQVPLPLAIVAAVAVGALVGLVNAFVVVSLGVSSFIATLGMAALLDGLSIRITNSATIPGIPPALVDFVTVEILGLQAVFWIGLLATVTLWYVLRHTPLGQRMYFTGSNRDVARLNGVKVDRTRAGALVTCSMVAASAGVLYSGVFGSADPFSGSDFLLPAFAAAFLGATAFTPGRFNSWGTFFAIYLVITGTVGLTLVTGQVGWISLAFNGAILIVAVSLQMVLAKQRERRRRPAGQSPAH
jgi:ribose transport system permease protein